MKLKEPPLDVSEMAALGKLFDDHRPQLLALVRQRLDPALLPRLDPEELLTKAFFKAQQRWPDFPRSGLEPYAWLCRVVLDCLYDEYDHHAAQRRDYRREQGVPDGSSSQFRLGLVSPDTSPSAAFARGELRQRLADTLAQLKPADQDILRKLYIDNLPLGDAARALGISENTARQRHFRALRRLKELWKQLYGTEGLEP
jgi:RNA polymerase sigma-70 factor (ECF subfamily)